MRGLTAIAVVALALAPACGHRDVYDRLDSERILGSDVYGNEYRVIDSLRWDGR